MHANLEENYDAVTASNHEALLQLLDQVGMGGGRNGYVYGGGGYSDDGNIGNIVSCWDLIEPCDGVWSG